MKLKLFLAIPLLLTLHTNLGNFFTKDTIAPFICGTVMVGLAIWQGKEAYNNYLGYRYRKGNPKNYTEVRKVSPSDLRYTKDKIESYNQRVEKHNNKLAAQNRQKNQAFQKLHRNQGLVHGGFALFWGIFSVATFSAPFFKERWQLLI